MSDQAPERIWLLPGYDGWGCGEVLCDLEAMDGGQWQEFIRSDLAVPQEVLREVMKTLSFCRDDFYVGKAAKEFATQSLEALAPYIREQTDATG